MALETTRTGDGVARQRGLPAGPGATPVALLDDGAQSLVPDATGDVVAVTGADGDVEAGYDYDPFANQRTTDATSGEQDPESGNPVRFGEMSADGLLGGLYSTPARTYDPGTGASPSATRSRPGRERIVKDPGTAFRTVPRGAPGPRFT